MENTFLKPNSARIIFSSKNKKATDSDSHGFSDNRTVFTNKKATGLESVRGLGYFRTSILIKQTHSENVIQHHHRQRGWRERGWGFSCQLRSSCALLSL